jgi:hypothetical protein
MVNHHLRREILDAVENQLKENDPACVRITLDRLTDIGFSQKKAKIMIAAVLVEEIYGILKNHERYNEESYCKNYLSCLNIMRTRTGNRLLKLPLMKMNLTMGIMNMRVYRQSMKSKCQ